MKIISEMSLKDFEFWSGGADRAKLLTDAEFDTIENYFEDIFPDGATDTQINDMFWFDFESICDYLGTTEDEIFGRE